LNVTSIVLNWNRREDTLTCLGALVAQQVPGDHRLLLVDNGSTDDTLVAVRAAHPTVAVLALPENRGYAAGVNAGVRRALASGADWTLLVNNDAVVTPGLLARLLDAGDAPRAGMVAPTIYHLDAPDRVWPSAGRRRRLTLAARDTTAHPPTRAPYDVDWATGCCLLVRRALWEDVGMFDARYRFYYEDHDLCIRARSAGWRILHVPDASALHRVAASTGLGTPGQLYLLGRASVPFYVAHTRGLHRAFIVPYRLGSLVRTLAESSAAGRPVAGRAYLRGVVDGVRDVVRARRDVAGATDAAADTPP
jgi:GT2 family glycosyltransferase